MAETEAEQRISIVQTLQPVLHQADRSPGEGYLETPFSLTEARVLYELAHRERPSATELARELAPRRRLPEPYLSAASSGAGCSRRTPSKSDGRQSHLALTARGRGRVRTARPALAREDIRRDAGAAQPGRAAPADRSDAGCGGDAGRRAGPEACHTSCAPISRATWAGWSTATGRSTRTSTASTSGSRRSSPGRRQVQSSGYDPAPERCWIVREGRGDRRGRYSWSDARARWRSCVCSWSNPRRGASGSASAWWPSASASPVRPATERSPCGPTACCAPPAASIRLPGSGESTARNTELRAEALWARRGSSPCEPPLLARRRSRRRRHPGRLGRWWPRGSSSTRPAPHPWRSLR